MKVLSISPAFPSSVDRSRGVFVQERLKALSELPGMDVRVISPTPWFPPIKLFQSWYRFSQYPYREEVAGLMVQRPRYLLPPKIGGYFHSQLIERGLARSIDRIRKEFEFELIDAHWVYPAGAFAVNLSSRYQVPAIMTGRGEDMVRFPSLPLVGEKIRSALARSNGCIGVSQEISDLMVEHGGDRSNTVTIPNGIDTTKFHRKDREACREACGLPQDIPIAISVGDRLELKGFHLIVEAMSKVRETFPSAKYVIVGGPGRYGRDYTNAIESRIERLGLCEHVLMVGPKPHNELIDWYNASDVYVMMSSREGSPNVLLESLACGTPAVATAVGGAQDELADKRLGRLISHRTANAAADAMVAEFENPKDPRHIAGVMRNRTWEDTATQVHEFMRRVVESYAGDR